MTRLSIKLAFALLTALLLAAAPAMAADLAVLHNGFSIRHERREVNGAVTRLYLRASDSSYVEVPNGQIDHFEKDLTPVRLSPAPPANLNQVNLNQVSLNPSGLSQPGLSEVVNAASSRHQLDPDLVNSLIRAESGFNSRAVSPKGAQGLMQLMPQTASRLGVANAFDPQANVEGGTQYLRALLEQYNFDLVKALAAYNAGPQRVARYGGVPPYYETQAYVARIVRDFNRKKLAERKGLTAAQTKSRKVPVLIHSTDSASLAQRATP